MHLDEDELMSPVEDTEAPSSTLDTEWTPSNTLDDTQLPGSSPPPSNDKDSQNSTLKQKKNLTTKDTLPDVSMEMVPVAALQTTKLSTLSDLPVSHESKVIVLGEVTIPFEKSKVSLGPTKQSLKCDLQAPI